MTDNYEFPEEPETTAQATDDVKTDAAAPGAAPAQPSEQTPTDTGDQGDQDVQPMDDMNDYSERLERLGGEPAPVITPEEFARLQKAGQVHIDARGRVRTTRRSDAEAGVSLRKRRAWYV